MKVNSSFPHPVLGINNGVISNIAKSDMLEIVSILEKEDTYEYTFQLNQDNDLISQYIKEGSAEYICEVDCSKTFYKVTHHSKESKLVIQIKKIDVTGHIDFFFYVVTTVGMSNYCNVKFNPDYRDPETGKMPSFRLDKGSILVMFPAWADNVNTRFYNNTLELNAFIQVVRRKDTEKTVDIDLGDDIINIELPEDRYMDFLEYNRDQYKGLFYTSLIFNALVKGILNMDKSEGLLWADSIKAIVESMPDKFQGLSLDEPSDAVDIATLMLSNPEYGTPYDLLFASIKNLQN